MNLEKLTPKTLQAREKRLRLAMLEQMHHVGSAEFLKVAASLEAIQAQMTLRGLPSSASVAAGPVEPQFVVVPSRSRIKLEVVEMPPKRKSPADWAQEVWAALQTKLELDEPTAWVTAELALALGVPYEKLKVSLLKLAEDGFITRTTYGVRGVQVLTRLSKRLDKIQVGDVRLKSAENGLVQRARSVILKLLEGGGRVAWDLQALRLAHLPTASSSTFSNAHSFLVQEGLVVKERETVSGKYYLRLA